MNILIFNWRDPKNPKAGGAEVVTLQHAKAWVKSGHNVYWFSSWYKGGAGSETFEGISLVRRGNDFSVFFLAPLYYFFSKIKFDLVIDEVHGLPFFTPLFVKKPKIIFIHEIADEIWNYMYPFPLSMIGKFFETFYLPLYKNIPLWTDAKSTIIELKKYGFKEESSFAIPCPPINKSLTKLPVKAKEKTFLFVSRVVRMKGVEEVIKAFGFIFREDPGAQLWIVGGGDKAYISGLKKMTKEYKISKNVTFFGKVDDKKKLELMSRAHLLLHASVKEGWGLVVVEAASQGTPSVVYNVAGLKDSVKNGKTGLVLKENAPYEMAQRSYALVMNMKKYRQFQQNGLAWAKSLKWDNVTKLSLDLIKKVTLQYNIHHD